MAPPVAPATMRLAFKIDIAFSGDRDVTRIASRWIHLHPSDSTLIEIFIHRRNNICFHSRSSFRLKGTVATEKALHLDWLLLCKYCAVQNAEF
jgi:hypothetical protein